MHLRQINVHSGLTKMSEYQYNLRGHRPGNSARYPKFIPREISPNDPEWGDQEHDILVFNSEKDEKWTIKWLRNLLEAKRYNVKINSTTEDMKRYINLDNHLSRVILVLTPEFNRKVLPFLQIDNLMNEPNKSEFVLVLKLKPCEIPPKLQFTTYMDLSFRDFTDATLQYRLLRKLLATLQLPRSICS